MIFDGMTKESSFIHARNLKEIFTDFLGKKSYLMPCIAAFANVITTYFGITYALESYPKGVYWVSAINGILLMSLSYLVIKDIYTSRRLSKDTNYGSRFRYRLVLLFTIAAIMPVLLLGLFSSLAFRNAARGWFDTKVERAVYNAQNVAEAYLKEHHQNIRADIFATQADLEQALIQVQDINVLWGAMRMQLLLRDLGMIVIYDKTGSAIMYVHSKLHSDGYQQEMIRLQPSQIIKIHRQNPLIIVDDQKYHLKAFKTLKFNDQLYILHITRAIDRQAVIYNDETKKAANDYNKIRKERFKSELGFALIYISFGIFIIILMVRMGQYFALQMTTPLRQLTHTALEIEAGNEMVRCPEPVKVRDEIDRLAIAFNQMVERLSTEKQLTASVLRGVSTGVICLDAHFKISLINQSALDIFKAPKGYQTHDLMELSSDFEQLLIMLKLLKTPNNPTTHDQLYRLKNGDKVHLHMRYHLYPTPIDTIHYMITIDDVSKLIRAQSAAAWQDIAQRIAHEIKNPLTPISLASERIERKWGKEIQTDKAAFLDTIAIIQKQVSDIQYTANSLSEFAKMPSPVFVRLDLYALIKQVIQLEMFRDETIEFLIAEYPPFYISGDSRLLSQALINIFKNASEAINDHKISDGMIKITLKHVNDHHVLLTIIDNGKGLPAEIPQHELFNPYVTTKDMGTGIGLAVTGKIIHDHQGKIILQNYMTENNEILGAIISIDLPLEIDDKTL